MLYVVDTNVLLRLADRRHPLHVLVRTAVRSLEASGHKLHALPQNYTEFWNVATRPGNRNGFGFTVERTRRLLRVIERIFPILADGPAIYPEWRRLVIKHQVMGIQVHDARLVAAMKVHGVTHILTFNVVDFQRYADEEIVPVDPLSF